MFSCRALQRCIEVSVEVVHRVISDLFLSFGSFWSDFRGESFQPNLARFRTVRKFTGTDIITRSDRSACTNGCFLRGINGRKFLLYMENRHQSCLQTSKIVNAW